MDNNFPEIDVFHRMHLELLVRVLQVVGQCEFCEQYTAPRTYDKCKFFSRG